MLGMATVGVLFALETVCHALLAYQRYTVFKPPSGVGILEFIRGLEGAYISVTIVAIHAMYTCFFAISCWRVMDTETRFPFQRFTHESMRVGVTVIVLLIPIRCAAALNPPSRGITGWLWEFLPQVLVALLFVICLRGWLIRAGFVLICTSPRRGSMFTKTVGRVILALFAAYSALHVVTSLAPSSFWLPAVLVGYPLVLLLTLWTSSLILRARRHLVLP